MVSEKLAEKGGWSVSQPFYLLPWFLEGDVSQAGGCLAVREGLQPSSL